MFTVFLVGTAGLVGLSVFVPPLFANGHVSEIHIPPILKGDISIRLETVAEGLTAPNWGTFAPGDTRHLFVSDQSGILWAIDLKSKKKDKKFVFLDVRDRLIELGAGGPNTYDERGLLGIAFHSKYRRNGLFYTYTSEPAGHKRADFSTMSPGEEPDHQNVITEWEARDPKNPRAGILTKRARVLMRIDQPQLNHNGGALNFGPDGMLYISLGDGGFEDDQGVGHGETGNSQDPSNILGTVLRINPTGSNSSNGRYGIPKDNPFVKDPGKLDEIFAYGFRNPFRFSFDMPTGRLYLADVGQHDVEEVDVVVSGGNYGWNLKEGSFFFDPEGEDEPGHATEEDEGRIPPGLPLIDPIAEYQGHQDGHAIIGGFVYRGSKIPKLVGQYVFGDYSSHINETFTEFDHGRLFHQEFEHLSGQVGHTQDIAEFQVIGQEDIGIVLLGMGQDACGELYALGNGPGIPFGNTGVVLKIVNGESHHTSHDSDDSDDDDCKTENDDG